ncbi:hypothetical protein [Falsiroseomonas oryziterrae]|uniref:hypothetical protein n=1 Tax=Falsiroseomonas oryziterrae TaxID=2911368 RepID=UPI001F1B1DF1|nr:hypothetical protein [Roseomonas sp. NPKOSM-4]
MKLVARAQKALPHTEIAPMMASWGRLAPLIVRVINACPCLAAQLVMAPPRVIHATAAFLQARIAMGRDNDPATLAAEIAKRDPRELLAEALGGDPRLFRALDRCGSTVWLLQEYEDLAGLLRGPLSDSVLGLQRFHHATLRQLREAEEDAVLIAARHVLVHDPALVGDLRAMLALLRGLGIARDIEALPHGAGRRAIRRRIEADLARAAPPTPPFAAPSGWRHCESVHEVQAVGAALKNCVASVMFGTTYIGPFLIGRMRLLRTTDEPLGLAAVEEVGPRLWSIAETQFRHDVVVARHRRAERLRSSLAEVLNESGHALLDQHPFAAIRHLHEEPSQLGLAAAED